MELNTLVVTKNKIQITMPKDLDFQDITKKKNAILNG